MNQLLKSVDLSEEARPDMRSQQGRIKTTDRQARAMNKQLNRKQKTIHDLSDGKSRFKRGRR